MGHAGSTKGEAHAPGVRDSTWKHGSGLDEILGKDWESWSSLVLKCEVASSVRLGRRSGPWTSAEH